MAIVNCEISQNVTGLLFKRAENVVFLDEFV